VRAFVQAWDQCAWDAQASEDLLLTLEPAHFVDLAPLYADLNATLLQAGVQAQTVYRIKESMGGLTGSAPLGSGSMSAPAPLNEADQGMGQRAQAGSAPGGEGRSGWSGLAPAGRSVATHARQFLQKLGLGRPTQGGSQGGAQGAGRSAGAGQSYGGSGGAGTPDDTSVMWSQADGQADASSTFGAADSEFMGYLGDLQAGAQEVSSYQSWEQQEPQDHNVLRRMRDREEVRRAPELDRGTLDALAEVFDYVFADQTIPLQMKYVIWRLQIPVLKAAMIDRDFFLSDTHPARRTPLGRYIGQCLGGLVPRKGRGRSAVPAHRAHRAARAGRVHRVFV
jgi:hypothetical protein